MRNVIYRDLGSSFFGFATRVQGEQVCILTPKASGHAQIQERVRQALRGQGMDCGTCLGCPVGRAQ